MTNETAHIKDKVVAVLTSASGTKQVITDNPETTETKPCKR